MRSRGVRLSCAEALGEWQSVIRERLQILEGAPNDRTLGLVLVFHFGKPVAKLLR